MLPLRIDDLGHKREVHLFDVDIGVLLADKAVVVLVIEVIVEQHLVIVVKQEQ